MVADINRRKKGNAFQLAWLVQFNPHDEKTLADFVERQP